MNRAIIGLVALVGFAGLGLQFWITLQRNDFAVLAAIVDFLSFFTIQSNIFVLAVSAAAAFRRQNFLTRPGVQAAAALYIFVVMLIYHAILRPLWDPQGTILLATTLQHYAVPIGYLFWWVAFADKGRLAWTMPLKWLLFPVAYCILSLVRGAVTGWYPYSFLDVAEIGYFAALRNAVVIAALFLLAGCGLVYLGRRGQRTNRPA